MMARRYLLLTCALCAVTAHAQQADGWAGMDGGTRGGGQSTPVVVGSVSELRAALEERAPVIHVAGIIDMQDGQPFANSTDQSKRGTIRVGSNTTLAGAGSGAGFINANLVVAKADNVIIRNLNLRNPCDVAPRWDPADGAKGNWNSLFDAITVSASTHVWIDHNSFTDAPHDDQQAPLENGMLKQCHDGALDINQGSDLVTVSHNRFALHEKNTLVGSSDKATDDAGRLRVTFSNNLFDHVSARAPRVRFGQVHLLNNYHRGDKRHPVYGHEYSVGLGKRADVIGDANVYDIAGARVCSDVVRTWNADSAFVDRGSLVNGEALACAQTSEPAWQVPYPFEARPAADVRAHVLANAGAGDWRFHAAGDGGLIALSGAALMPPSSDFYIEARIRVLKPERAGQLYLLGGQGANTWSGAGVSMDGATLQANLVRMRDGQLVRLKQLRRMPAKAGEWRLVRFEREGSALAVYVDGEKLGSAQEASQPPGVAGFYSKGNAFEIASVRSGFARDKPARITPALSDGLVKLQAGDAPRLVGISALAGDGLSRVPFTAVSSDSRVATVGTRAGQVRVVPGKPGAASIAVASAADPAVRTTLAVSVGARFVMPAKPLDASPASNDRDVAVDTPLRIRLSHPAPPGTTGSVRIYRKRDMTLADVIYPGEEVSAIGTGKLRRYVRRTHISGNGNELIIRPHGGVLAYDTDYLVAVGLEGVHGRWSFRTRKAAPNGSRLVVDDDGPADFRTVQGALDHAMTSHARSTPALLDIRNGSYEELLYLRGRDNLTLRGETRDGVVIHALNNESLHPGSGSGQAAGAPGVSGGRAVLLVEDADMLTLESLTLRNSTERRHSASGQAETIHFNSEAGRLVARDASFLSEQDTLQLKGYAWFYRTLVAGNVDFIWGANRAALFEQSEIRTVGDSNNPENGGYIVQARTVAATDPGFVFLDCALTHGPGPAGNNVPAGRTFLARSPGTANTWDNVSYIGCKMDSHIAASGWAGSGDIREPAPNPARPDATRGWREHGSTDAAGNPLDLSQRQGGFVLPSRAPFATRADVFAGFNGGKGWDPQP